MDSEQLKELRLSLNLNKTQMAERLGIAYRMYHYIEKGERMLSKASALLAEQMAKALNP